jgi:hypothetical protein
MSNPLSDFFKQTSDELYLRHDYRVHFSNGNSLVFDNYEDVQRTWFQTPHQFLGYVEVLDKKKTKPKSKGF